MNLLNLDAKLKHLNDLIESIESSEIPPELEDAFAQLLNQREQTETAYLKKIDNIVNLIQSLKYWIGIRKQERSRINSLIKTDLNKLNWLKSYLVNHLHSKDISSLKTPRFNLTIANNGGKQPLIVDDDVDLVNLPYEYQKIRLEIDRDAVREALEQGEQLDFARLATRSLHLRIR